MAESEPLILDGKLVAAKLTGNLRGEVDALKAMGHTPGLAVVLVGSNPASQVYVRNKVRTCAEVGMRSEKIELAEGTTQMELLAVVERLNRDEGIHGILVQSPVPGGIDEAAVVRAIDPAKDVDGFHPVNVARLAMGDDGAFVPCTPLGCVALLEHYGIPLAGANVVILGRSLIVGKPLALLLMRKGVDATVTVAHSRSRDLERITRGADIVVAAMGVPEFVGGRHLREGQVVIDVGINRVADARAAKGWRLTGDVNFSEAAKVCRAITPVPGGVGPMTIAMLLRNTVKACRERTAGG